jgi:hypothetical protein
MTALQSILKEAKALKKSYPNRYDKWTDYVKQASAIYAGKHKGKSPVGKKRVVKKSAAKKTIGRSIVSLESIERMDQLTKSTDLIMFSKGINNIIDNLLDDGFHLTEIKEYIKERLNIIYHNLK